MTKATVTTYNVRIKELGVQIACVLWPESEANKREWRAWERCLDALEGFSSVVEAEDIGVAYVDITALAPHYEAIEDLGRMLTRAVHTAISLEPSVGIAASPFAAQMAVAVQPPQTRPARLEFAGYHAADGSLAWGGFLDETGESGAIRLSAEERRRRSAMLDCFETQKSVLVFASPLIGNELSGKFVKMRRVSGVDGSRQSRPCGVEARAKWPFSRVARDARRKRRG